MYIYFLICSFCATWICSAQSLPESNTSSTCLADLAKKFVQSTKTFSNKLKEFDQLKANLNSWKKDPDAIAQLVIDYYSLISAMNFSIYMPELAAKYDLYDVLNALKPYIKKKKVFNSNQTYKAINSLKKQ